MADSDQPEPSGQQPRQLRRRPEEDAGDKPTEIREPSESGMPEAEPEPVSPFAKANWKKFSESKKAPPAFLTIALKTLYVILALVVVSTIFSWIRGAGNPAQPEARKQFDELKSRIDGLETFPANPPPEISQLATALKEAFTIQAELEGMGTPTEELAKRIPIQLERVTKSIADFRGIALNDGTYQGTREKVEELIGSLSASEHQSEFSGLIDGLNQISAELEKTAAPDDLVTSFADLPEKIFLIGPDDRGEDDDAPADFSTFVYPGRINLENSIFIERSPPIEDLGNWLLNSADREPVIAERFDLPAPKDAGEILRPEKGIAPVRLAGGQPASPDSPELRVIQISPVETTLKISPKIGGEACLAVISDGETSTALLLWGGVELPVSKEALLARSPGEFTIDKELEDFLKRLRLVDAPEESIVLSFHYRMPEAFEAIAWLGQQSLVLKDNLNDGFHGWKIDHDGLFKAENAAKTELAEYSAEASRQQRLHRKNHCLFYQFWNLSFLDDSKPFYPFDGDKEYWINLWQFDRTSGQEEFRNSLRFLFEKFVSQKIGTNAFDDLVALDDQLVTVDEGKYSSIWAWSNSGDDGKTLTFYEGLTRLGDGIRDFRLTREGQAANLTTSQLKWLQLFASNLELFSPFLSKNEITNVIQFHEDLSKGKHPVGRRIWSRIPGRYLKKLGELEAKKPKGKGKKGKPGLTREQASVFMAGLNRALMADPLFEESAFKGVELSEETRALLKKNRNAPGLAGVPLNRRLLEDAFPGFVKKRSGWPEDSQLARSQQKYGLWKPVQGAEIVDLLRSPPGETPFELPKESKETLEDLLTFLDRFDRKDKGTPAGRYEVRIHRGDNGTGKAGPILMSFDIPWKGGKE